MALGVGLACVYGQGAVTGFTCLYCFGLQLLAKQLEFSHYPVLGASPHAYQYPYIIKAYPQHSFALVDVLLVSHLHLLCVLCSCWVYCGPCSLGCTASAVHPWSTAQPTVVWRPPLLWCDTPAWARSDRVSHQHRCVSNTGGRGYSTFLCLWC
jgi:hypothetical protein